jgi:hypothetical protein
MTTLHPSYAFLADWNDSPPMAHPAGRDYQRRALAIWPGLDRTRLRRTNGDPWKIATVVAARSSLSLEAILVLLMGAPDARAGAGSEMGHRAHVGGHTHNGPPGH